MLFLLLLAVATRAAPPLSSVLNQSPKAAPLSSFILTQTRTAALPSSSIFNQSRKAALLSDSVINQTRTAVPPSSSAPAVSDQTQDMYGNWTQVKCTDYGVTDAALPSDVRWNALDAQGAWEDVVNAWNNDPPPPGDVQLEFPEFVMNYYHGPDNWNCRDIEDSACAPGVLECGDTAKGPASWLVGNSLANIHNAHKEIYDALGASQLQMQAYVGLFAATFEPVDADNSAEIIKEILDAVAFVFGGLSAYFWNRVAESVFDALSDSGKRGFSKDVFNGMTSYAIGAGKDSLGSSGSSALDQLNEQNELSEGLGVYFGAWQKAQSEFVKQIFDGSGQTLPELGSLVYNGQMNWPVGQNNTPNFQDLVDQSQKLMYAQMIPKAWQHSVTARSPIVLESTDDCTSTAGTQMNGYMSDDTAAATHMCMNGRIYYLVNVKQLVPPHPGPQYCGKGIPCPRCPYDIECPVQEVFEALPGGTFDNLSGLNWGNVRIDDIVIASYQGWVSNGNKNGWGVPDFLSQIQGGASPSDLFVNGIQTAGYNSIPFCSVDNWGEISKRVRDLSGDITGPFWPCE
ncbi:Carbohydrate esterase family 3 protein [Mycena venus]|uniref:Carbohydrate esterase family 3 protein n=1 Tax=Mycena venus TaxID=2733690 RepID=A0A8H6U3P8_9AGAR|nr:Carbohydrate esterase family 3 protein [Mycena venus]